jgi:hypothetical protein
MIRHTELGKTEYQQSKKIKFLLNSGLIAFAGNSYLRIYGTLQCSSGKRMKAGNRVFLINEAEAIKIGYRPCGHCMRAAYQKWKTLNPA